MSGIRRSMLCVILAGGILLSAGGAATVRTATAGEGVPARSASAARDVLDVTLTPDGRLSGRVVDGTGLAQWGQSVQLACRGDLPRRTVTDQLGMFHFEHVSPGAYSLSVGQNQSIVRAWSPATAPPVARSQPTLVTGSPVIRGQMVAETATGLLIFGGAVAGVTVATYNAGDKNVSLPLIPPGPTPVPGPISTAPIDTGDVPISSLERVTLDTTGANVDGVGLRFRFPVSPN